MQNQRLRLVTPPKVELIELRNLFFQLCAKTCNLKCKFCYIEKNPYKNNDDFMDLEKIKQSLQFVKGKALNSIYLTGGEPLMHPDFNQILRMCLKISNVTVMSNGIMINDKKARFLRKIDDESHFETIYRISLDSVDELENDSYRGRGSFRKAICAIMSLLKYEFNPIISVVNYKNKTHKEIYDEFKSYFLKKGFEMDTINLKIIPFFSKNDEIQQIESFDDIDFQKLDCSTSRVVTQNGVYSCPLLADDYRARMGSGLGDFSVVNYLDCEKCSVCAFSNSKIQVNDWM